MTMNIIRLKQSKEELRIIESFLMNGSNNIFHAKYNDRVRIIDEKELKIYKFGSVLGEATDNYECPINAVLNAIENNKSIHWLKTEGHVDIPNMVGVGNILYGQKVLFEGRLFTIDKDCPELLGSQIKF